MIHYDNGTTFCEVQETSGARGEVTADEEAVTCGACLERFGRIEFFLARTGASPPRREARRQIDWFGEG